ncbi:hypothetical protein A3800_28955 [Streptomyces badius]|nr:hypothetical protein A3800_28955 [Streptomyces badius]
MSLRTSASRTSRATASMPVSSRSSRATAVRQSSAWSMNPPGRAAPPFCGSMVRVMTTSPVAVGPSTGSRATATGSGLR